MAEWQKWIHTYYLWYTPTPTPTPTTLKSFILQRQYFTTYLIYPAIFMVHAADDVGDTDGF